MSVFCCLLKTGLAHNEGFDRGNLLGDQGGGTCRGSDVDDMKCGWIQASSGHEALQNLGGEGAGTTAKGRSLKLLWRCYVCPALPAKNCVLLVLINDGDDFELGASRAGNGDFGDSHEAEICGPGSDVLNDLGAALRRDDTDVESLFLEEPFRDRCIPGGVPTKRNKVE